MNRISSFLVMMTCSFVFAQSTEAEWVHTNGPTGHGGAVFSICVEDSTVFAGGSFGVYVSTDEGNSWIRTNPTIPPSWRVSAGEVYSLASDGQDVFEPNYSVFISSDGGATWSVSGLSYSSDVTTVGANGNWIIAGGNDARTFQSTDGGTSWTMLDSASGGIFGITGILVQNTFALIGSGYGISRSADHGTTWHLVDSTMSGLPPIGFAVSGSQIFAGSGNEVSVSTDQGATWETDSVKLNCYLINAMACSPAGSGTNFVFAGTDSGIYRSSDGGASWSAVDSGLSSHRVFSLAFETQGVTGNPILYAGTSLGVFRSKDYGNTWTSAGPTSGSAYLASCPQGLFAAAGYSLYMGHDEFSTSLSGQSRIELYRSTDGASSWEDVRSAFDTLSGDYLMSPLFGDEAPGGDYDLFFGLTKYVNGSANAMSFASSDGGSTWASLDPTSPGIFPMAVCPSGLLGVGDSGICLSTDNGETWEAARDSGLAMPPWDGYRNVLINALAVSGDTIFAGCGYKALVFAPGTEKTEIVNYILTSTDAGATWHPADSGFTATTFPQYTSNTTSLLTCMYADGSDLIVGTKPGNEGEVAVPTGGGIYRCVRNGSAWTLVDSSMSGRYVFNFVSYGSNVFVATDSGVFRSTDGGATWRSVSSGLRDLDVTSMVVSNSYMFAATLSGVWKRPLSELTSVDAGAGGQQVPRIYSLSQNYPNPFNPTTVIKFGVRSSGLVSLKVYDVLGRLVKTLVDENEKPGNHQVDFNGAGLSSGVYFCRMKAGNFSKTLEMMLLK